VTAAFASTAPSFATTGAPLTPGGFFGEIASDGCDNCESQGIRINGHGVLLGSGIESVRGSGIPSTTPGSDDGGYIYPVPENPLTLPSRNPAIAVSNPGEVGLFQELGPSVAPAVSTTTSGEFTIKSFEFICHTWHIAFSSQFNHLKS